MAKITNIEILYIAGSNRDKRVLIRCGGTENWIYQEDGVDDVDGKILGITDMDRRHIRGFFGGLVVRLHSPALCGGPAGRKYRIPKRRGFASERVAHTINKCCTERILNNE